MTLCDPSVLSSIQLGTSFSQPAKSTKLATPTASDCLYCCSLAGPTLLHLPSCSSLHWQQRRKFLTNLKFLTLIVLASLSLIGKGSAWSALIGLPCLSAPPLPCCVLWHPENHDSDREHIKKASDDPQNSDRFGERVFKSPVEIQKQPASLPFSPISTSLGRRAAHRQKMEDNFDSSRKEEIRT